MPQLCSNYVSTDYRFAVSIASMLSSRGSRTFFMFVIHLDEFTISCLVCETELTKLVSSVSNRSSDLCVLPFALIPMIFAISQFATPIFIVLRPCYYAIIEYMFFYFYVRQIHQRCFRNLGWCRKIFAKNQLV